MVLRGGFELVAIPRWGAQARTSHTRHDFAYDCVTGFGAPRPVSKHIRRRQCHTW